MAEAKKKLPQLTSPVGTFKYPKLTEPDYGTKEYPNPDGSFSVKLVMDADAPETKAFIAALQPHYEEAMAAAQEAFKALPIASRKKLEKVTQNPLFTEIYDKETEQPTGQIEFSIKMKHKVTIKKGPKAGKVLTFFPTVFDALGNRMTKLPAIWGGTRGRVSFEVFPYFVASSAQGGLGLRMLGVQIIELVQGGARSAESLGFGAVEGGYSYSEADAAPAAEDATDTVETGSKGDF
jgi:hypothetical protein